MAKNYEIKAKVDMSQHNGAFKQGSLEVYKYEKKVQAAKAELNNFNRSVNGAVGGLSSLSGAFKSGNILGFTQALQGVVPALSSVTSGVGGLTSAFSTAINPWLAAAAAIGAIGVAAIKSAADFETHLDSLQSLTGLDDAAMKSISDGAIEMSKRVKGSAGEIVDSMKLIGSQAPELLQMPDALMKVTEAANILASAAKIEVVDSAKAITTVMNQMGADASKANDIINTLAAGSQQGAADVAYLNTAFEKAGTAAHSAGLSYVELTSAIEAVAPKFSSADVAGQQLYSTLLKLSVQGNDKFKPAVVGMQQALDNLAAAQLTDAQLKKLVGERNITMVKTLIQAKDQYAQFTQTLAGTNTAFEQAKINGDNLQGAINRLKSAWDAFILGLGQSGVLQGVLGSIESMIKFVQDLINHISELSKHFTSFGEGAKQVNLFSLELQALGKVFDAVFEVINVALALVKKNWEITINAIKSLWQGLQNTLNNNGWANAIINALKEVVKWFSDMVNKLIGYWNKLKSALGMPTSGSGHLGPETSGRHTSGQQFRDRIPKATPTVTTTSASGGGTKSGGRKSTGGGTTKKDTWPSNLKKMEKGLDVKAKLKDLDTKQLKPIDLPIAKVDNTSLTDKVRDAVSQFYDQGIAKANRLKDLFSKGIIDKDTYEKELQELIDTYKDKFGIDLKVNLDKKDTLKDMQDVVNSVSGAFSQLGQAIGGTGGQMIEFAAQSIQAISEVIPQIIALIGAKQAEATASGTASAAALPFPANIAAIASIVATIASIFAGLASFADGGIIGGSTRFGDYNIARVNSGEMILNGQQQGNLWKAISTNRLGGTESTIVAGDVKIKGSDLFLALKNYNKLSGKRL